ncbi:MAG: DUF2306 domain-containing protein [Pirellulales bacterium]
MTEVHSSQLATTPASSSSPIRITLIRVVTVCAYVLVLKVIVEILWQYRDYFPPRFDDGFLRDHESYFWGVYSLAFYVHLATGPMSLVCGLLLASSWLRARWPQWHRRLGRIQVPCVLFGVAPSGLWMAMYAASGVVSAVALASLALVTSISAWCGWRAAWQRDWTRHQRWMSRTLVLLVSAVVLRLIGGTATVLNYEQEWLYPASTWFSWCVPLALLELYLWSAGSFSSNKAGE